MKYLSNADEPSDNPDTLGLRISELLVATADGSDELIDASVHQVLRLLRQRMKMDVVFVSEFTDGKRVFRQVDTTSDNAVIAAGGYDPLENSWCQRMVDGRLPEYIPDATKHPASASLEKLLPFRIGTYISKPIVLKSGGIYGTLCSFSFSPKEKPNPTDIELLKYTAQLIAHQIDKTLATAKQKASEQPLKRTQTAAPAQPEK